MVTHPTKMATLKQEKYLYSSAKRLFLSFGNQIDNGDKHNIAVVKINLLESAN